MTPKVTVLTYGASNVTNVVRALERAGADASVAEPGAKLRCERLVLPGQGHFGQAVKAIGDVGMDWIRERIRKGMPILGICLGMQLLFDSSDEASGHHGLGVFAGKVQKLSAPRLPHVGWNTVTDPGAWPAAIGWFYFCHSYAAYVSGSHYTEYQGQKFTSLVKLGPISGVQFHPEKSQAAGQKFLKEWLKT